MTMRKFISEKIKLIKMLKFMRSMTQGKIDQAILELGKTDMDPEMKQKVISLLYKSMENKKIAQEHGLL